MRHYEGFLADSARWNAVALRDDDVIVTTPSKCGTTWMQTIVGMLIHGRVDLGEPMGVLSPWVDFRVRGVDEVASRLEGQTHRRFMKSHTPLDGLPWRDTVTYLAVLRHPLDAALSMRDHRANLESRRAMELRLQTEGEDGLEFLADDDPPEHPGDWLRWWIGREVRPTGTGGASLHELACQAHTYWEARHRPNVHLFHYSALQADLDAEMRRTAAALGVEIDASRWPGFVEAAGFGSMKERAAALVPEAHLGLWHSTGDFFKEGGRRGWDELLSAADVARFRARLRELVGDECARWVEEGVLDGG